MEKILRAVKGKYNRICSRIYTGTYSFMSSNSSALLLLGGIVLLIDGLSSLSEAATVPAANGTVPAAAGGSTNAGNPLDFDDTELRKAWCALYALSEGAWGGLVATASGIGAIVASATGQYRAAFGLLVTSVSAFALRSFVSLYFGTLDGCEPSGSLSPFPNAT